MKFVRINDTAILYVALFYVMFQPAYLYAQDYYYLQERIEILEEKVFWLEQLFSSKIDSLKQKHEQSEKNTILSNKNSYSNNSPKYSSVYDNSSGDQTKYNSSQHSNNTENSRTSSTEITTNAASMKYLIKARVFKKEWESSKSGSKMSILIAFTNTTPQDITSFKGDVILKDYIGNDLTRFFIEFDKHISSYGSKSWYGEVPYNYQKIKNDFTELRTIRVDELMTILEPKEILFADGTRQIAK